MRGLAKASRIAINVQDPLLAVMLHAAAAKHLDLYAACHMHICVTLNLNRGSCAARSQHLTAQRCEGMKQQAQQACALAELREAIAVAPSITTVLHSDHILGTADRHSSCTP